MKVLVVDDSQTILDLVSTMLDHLGYEYELVTDGELALQTLRSGKHFDFTLLDWNMPKLNGPGVLDAIRDQKLPAGAVVMMTTENSPTAIITALNKGAVEYIMKPFTEEILKAKLEYAKHRTV